MAFLTPQQIEKYQAESEGYQQGPTPDINNQNVNTQDNLGNPTTQSVSPALLIPPPYYPGATETPVMQLSLTNMPVNVAENFVLVDALAVSLLPAGIGDFTGLVAGQGFSLTPVTAGVYQVVIVGTSIPPQIPFTAAQMTFNVAYTDNAGPQYTDGAVTISDNLLPKTVTSTIFALPTAPITIYSSFVTFGVAGALPANNWNTQVTLGGTGTAAYGATLHQTTSGATAFYYGVVAIGGPSSYLIYTVLTGVDDGTHKWTDSVSGQTFTPLYAGTQVAGTFTPPGIGVNMAQFVTGAFGPELNSPTTIMYLGPHVSGVANLPSGYLSVPGPAPSLTHNYAWYDPIGGGVFVPTAA